MAGSRRLGNLYLKISYPTSQVVPGSFNPSHILPLFIAVPQTRTTSILLIATFLHAIVFFSAAFYLPLYYQILGASATGAGIRMIPFSFGGALFSTAAGLITSKTGRWRPVVWFAWCMMLVGYGIMTMLSDTSSMYDLLNVLPLSY